MWVVGVLQVKQLRLDQTINLTCGDLEIPFVVIRLGVIGLKKTRLMYLLDLFEGSLTCGNQQILLLVI